MSHPSTIAIAPNITDFFQEVISDAIRVRKVDATDAAARYLVGLLCAYAHPTEEEETSFNRPLTLQLHDALETATGTERFRRLRALGDHALYAIGFFGGQFEQRGVDQRYVCGVGSTAYTHAAGMLRLKGKVEPSAVPDVLRELATKFERFAAVLRDVAEGTLASGARDERSVVRLYERWLKTGSSRIAEELGARGILPTRGAGGSN